MPEFPFDLLRRWPDTEASNLFAVDASDRLILDEAAPLLESAGGGAVAILGDHYGALTLGAGALGARGVRVHQDSLVGERALQANAQRLGDVVGRADFVPVPLGPELLGGAEVVLMQLPRSLAELDEWSDAIARWAAPSVTVIAGGRLKHMTRAMNDVLARSFEEVTARLARQKSRALVGRGPRGDRGPSRFPITQCVEGTVLPGGELVVCAHGGAFAGAALDVGTRYLLEFLPQFAGPVGDAPAPGDVIDLGSGTGILATALARSYPRRAVLAVDSSAAAVLSTLATAEANDVADRVRAVREDALTERPDRSARLIVCNPPFHSGAAVQSDLALRVLGDARRVLRRDGELWTVFNTHLAHAPALQRLVGPTEVMGQNAKFTVTRSRVARGEPDAA